MQEDILELLNTIENSYKKNPLEALLESEEYFENTNLYESFQEFKEKTKYLLIRLKAIASRNEMYEAVDLFDELLDNAK